MNNYIYNNNKITTWFNLKLIVTIITTIKIKIELTTNNKNYLISSSSRIIFLTKNKIRKLKNNKNLK